MRNYPRILYPLLLCVSLILLRTEPVSAVSIREILGLNPVAETENDPIQGKATTTATPAKEAESKPVAPGAGEGATADKNTWAKPEEGTQQSQKGLEFDYIQNLISNLGQDQRKAVLDDKQKFRQFVQSEADNRSVISAAMANKLDRDGNTLFLMQRGAENILRESYMNRLLIAKIPADFPNDQQVKDYYDKNKDRFVIGKRVHVWQIFLPMGKDMDNKTKVALRKEAETIITDISKGKYDFAAAALKHSKHEASQYNGGYMGLIKVADLIPGIENPLLALQEGTLSKPIETEAGLHLLKRGAVVDEQQVELKQVDAQVRRLLRQQVVAQLRKSILEQASKSYPIDLEDNRIEEWRLKLRTSQDTKPNNPAD